MQAFDLTGLTQSFLRSFAHAESTVAFDTRRLTFAQRQGPECRKSSWVGAMQRSEMKQYPRGMARNAVSGNILEVALQSDCSVRCAGL